MYPLDKKLSFKLLIILVLLVFAGQRSFAENKEKEGEFNPGEMIMHHVADSHEWHFATIGHKHYSISLPVILYTDKGLDIFFSSEFHHHAKDVEHEHEGVKHHYKELKRGENTYLLSHSEKISLADGRKVYDFSITKNVASMLVSVILLFLVFFAVASGYKKRQGAAPKGIQSFFEPIIIFIRDDIAKGAIGPKYERFLPYLLTVFFYIWFNNLLGLMPGSANVTGNIAVTFTLAVFTFLITNLSANKNYWTHIFNTPGVPLWLKVFPLMPLVEFIGVFTKPFALMIRLFANITAGHIIILSFISLIFVFKTSLVGLFSVPFAVVMMFLELFVALLQAYVFTLLSALYFGSAVEEHHHEEEHHH